jgi:hypothetical protein
MMGLMTILKKLKTLYGRTLNRDKWPVALQAVGWPANGTNLFEGHSLPRQPFPKVRGVGGMTKSLKTLPIQAVYLQLVVIA